MPQLTWRQLYQGKVTAEVEGSLTQGLEEFLRSMGPPWKDLGAGVR